MIYVFHVSVEYMNNNKNAGPFDSVINFISFYDVSRHKRLKYNKACIDFFSLFAFRFVCMV